MHWTILAFSSGFVVGVLVLAVVRDGRAAAAHDATKAAEACLKAVRIDLMMGVLPSLIRQRIDRYFAPGPDPHGAPYGDAPHLPTEARDA